MWIRLGRKKPKSLRSVLRGVEAYLRLLMAAGVVLSLVSPQARAVGGGAKPAGAAPLPVPCGGAACTTRGGPTQWLTSGSVDSPVTNGNTMSIHQNSQSAILNWASFDIANGYTVRFDQPNSDAVALNKIFQGAPSKIFGNLIANGNVFLVNTNGILFGSGSQVNLHGLIASSLDIKDEVFNLGITNAINSTTHEAAFDSTNSIEDAIVEFGDYKQVNAGIMVEEGADITAASGGYVRLFGPDVTNRGTISAPEGVVMLAAGKQIYLYETTNPNMRGVFVDVGVGGTLSNVGGGVVSNTGMGVISAARGNITMQGSMVNQSGRLTATTTVNTNGSIRLIAADSASAVNDTTGVFTAPSHHTGSVMLGAGSFTEVLPELQDSATSVAEQEFKRSYVQVLGHDITMESGSGIHAAGGNVQLRAADDPAALLSTPALGTPAPRIYLGAGSSIDVSGTTDTVLAMDHNAVDVELRGVQLADAPLQRDGVLSGQKVTIDARTGSTLANVSGALAGVGKNVGERTAAGGTIGIESQGDVITQAGSSIDVSGGKVTYQGGYVNTTKLIGNDGKIYDIGSASPDRTYVGILGQYTQTNRKWGQVKTWSNEALRGAYQQGYMQGADAGSVTIKAAGAVLDGSLLGRTEAGVLQRDPHRDPTNPKLDAFGSVLADPYSAPQGGQLVIGDSVSEGESDQNKRDFLTPAIDIAAHAAPSSLAADAPNQNGKTVHLGADALAQSGMARIDLYSNGKISVHDDVDLHVAPGGEIKLVGAQLDMQGGLHTPGGTIELKTKAIKSDLNPTDNNLQLGARARVDVHGLWVNDAPGVAGADTAVKNINGGKIVVSSEGDAALPTGSVLDAGGGAWLQANGKVKNGNGGSINIATANTQAAHTLQLDAQLLGDAPGNGGSLTVTANAVRIDHSNIAAPAPATAPELLLTPEFFQRGGFGNFSVNANIGGLTIAPDTIVAPQAQTRVIDTAAKQQASGADVRTFSQLETLSEAQRKAVDLTFTSAASNPSNESQLNTLHVAEGARVMTEAGGTITVSGGKVVIDGSLIAPGGAINITGGGGKPTKEGFELAGIALGEHALLAATGAMRYQLNAQDLLKGAVLDAGSVKLNAASGYVATATGSIIDVSAIAAPLDLPADAAGHVTRTTLSGKAGSVGITASEGMLLNGAIDAHAAPGQGAQGGTLSLTLTRKNIDVTDASNSTYPTAQRELVIQAGNIAPLIDLNPAFGLSKDQNGRATINVSSIDASGVTQFTARSDDAIRFEGDVNLHTERSVQLDAPVLSASNGADVHVSSAYVAIGNAQPLQQFTTTGGGDHGATGGDAQLHVNAQLLDLIGTHATQNIGSLELHSDGDLRLRGELIGSGQGAKLVGALNTVADMKLHADQIYPTTFTQFTINASKPDSTVTIEAGDGDHPVLSAAGTLTINAPNIVQQGVLKAPFGQITLNAEKQLTLAAGSKTSVAGEGLTVPFGKTANGTQWVYDFGSTILTFDAPPEKRIDLNSHDVDLRDGAQVDVSGGGDLYAYEFLPGPGGSRDVLLDPHSFAVLPGLQDGVAPVDYQYQYSDPKNPIAGLQPGERVYLSGIPGLQAGFYTLLPAHYALLDGAFLVKPLSGYQDMTPGQSVHLLDGTPVVAGYYDVAGTTLRDGRWSGFAVQPGSTARAASEFHDRSANTFFAQQAVDNEHAVPRLPGDAGTLAIAVQNELKLDGSLQGGHADGARGAQLDIAAANIAVVDAPDTSDTGAVQIRVDSLAKFGAESVLLGGARTGTADGSTTVDVSAQNVRIADGVQMQGAEILLAARNEVTIGHDAKVSATGAQATGSADRLEFDGDSALVRVSTHQQAQIARSNNTAVSGVVDIQSGAVLTATGSMTLDATNDTRLDGRLQMTGGSLSLGASRIGIGAVPDATPGLHLSSAQIADLKVDELVLNSHSSIDLWGKQDITTNDLTLSAGAIISHDLAQDQTIGLRASTLTLANRDHVAAAASAEAPSGTLHISADTVQLEAGMLTLDGAAHTVIDAHQKVVATDAGALKSGQDLTINTPLITGTHHADYTVQAAQALALNWLGGLNKPNAAELGARLDFIGQSVAVNTLLEAHSGNVTVRADGSDDGDHVTVGPAGNIDVSGVTKEYGDVDVHSPGGTVTLSSAHGDVDIQTGARIDVSAPDTGAHAGELDLSAVNGTLKVNGMLHGSAAADQEQAVLHADAQSLGDFARLNAALNAGGFTGERDFRQRAGDLTVGGSAGVQAHNVRISADNGAITIMKTTDSTGNTVAAIDAHGAEGGRVEVYAQNNLTLGADALIDAHVTGTNAHGGDVVLATQKGQLDLSNASSTIDVRGSKFDTPEDIKTHGGTLHLRAPTMSGNDVAITRLAATVNSARAVSIEPIILQDYHDADVKIASASNVSALKGSVDAYMTNVAKNIDAIHARLGNDIHITPGLDIKTTGNIELNTDWNFGDSNLWRYGSNKSDAGVFTLRAGGNITFNKSLSDGFSSAAANGILRDDGSWSYRIVAGADGGAADPLALRTQAALAPASGDIALAKNALVRTGTGSIDIRAAHDLNLNDQTSVIYTAGTQAAALSSFAVPKNASYGTHGGNVSVSAQGNITAAPSDQFITDWLWRQGQLNKDGTVAKATSWWTRTDLFQEGIGALGGGDVDIRAGGNMDNISVMLPTSGRLDVAVGGDPMAAQLDVRGGGDLTVRAGGDINGGVFYVGRGTGSLRAAGSIGKGSNPKSTIGSPLVLALGDARMNLEANGNVTVDAAVNPTLLPQGKTASLSWPSWGSGKYSRTYFSTYSPQATLDVQSLRGNTVFDNTISDYLDLMIAAPNFKKPGTSLNSNLGNAYEDALMLFPPIVQARALQGSIAVAGQRVINLAPAPNGNLQFIAATDVKATTAAITQFDSDPANIPSPARPEIGDYQSAVKSQIDTSANSKLRATTLIHEDDLEPVEIVARDGDVELFSLDVAKSAHVHAGRDIKQLTLHTQNIRATDITVIEAGRDVTFPSIRGAGGELKDNSAEIEVAGPGQLYVEAGRNIDLGDSKGISTVAARNNPALPEHQGASITAVAGAAHAADYAGFIKRYLEDSDVYGESLVKFMKERGLDTSITAFKQLNLNDQRALLLDIFFNELRESGRAAAQASSKEYARGRSAIATLFPQAADAAADYHGDINLFFSRIYTVDGGDINLLVPGGLVNAGLASLPPGSPVKSPAEKGIVAQAAGSVRAYTRGDFLVNQERVFTLQGGDILLWSDHGNIDAGRGAKTAISAPAPTYDPQPDGSIKVNFAGAVAGSGIRAIVTDPGVQPGNVDLIAPDGNVNAGDAGIGSAGNLTIAAQHVLGADNIQVGGVSSGVPVVDSGSFAASLSGVGNLANSVTKNTEQALDSVSKSDNAAPIADAALTFLDVEVLGYGDDKEDGKPTAP